MPRILVLVVCAFFAMTAASRAMAQANGLDREHSTSALIEFGHPFLEPVVSDFAVFRIDSPHASTGVLLFAARHRFFESLAAVVDVPISHYDWNVTGERIVSRDSVGFPDSFAVAQYRNSGTGLGNCYFGIELLVEDSPLAIEAGVRPNFNPPFGPGSVAIATDLALWEAFVPGTTYRAGFRTHTDLSRPTSFRVRGAASVITGYSIDSQLFLLAGGTLVQRVGAWILSPALDGRLQIANEVRDHVVAQVEMTAERQMAHARPGLFARFYLNSDWHDAVPWTLGVRCNAF